MYRFGSARQKAAYHGEYAPRRGHRRGRKPAAVGYGTRGLRQLLFVHGGRHRAVHPAMLTLVIGGAASGKSAYAESLTLKLPLPRYYVATMQVWDEECAKRVEKHRAMRKEKQFETIESPISLDKIRMPNRGIVLLEDLGNLTANELYDPKGAGVNTAEAVLYGVEILYKQCEHLIIVGNEVFSGGTAYADETDLYLKALAQIQNGIAARADHVCRVVCGIPVYYKGGEKV